MNFLRGQDDLNIALEYNLERFKLEAQIKTFKAEWVRPKLILLYLAILFNSLSCATFGNNTQSSLNLKSDTNLGSSFIVFLCNFNNFVIVQQQRISRFSPGTIWRSKRTVRRYLIKKKPTIILVRD